MMIYKISFMLAALLSIASAANILLIVPVPSTSHIMLFEPLALELAQKGHQVTYIAARKLPKQSPNIKEIIIETKLMGPDGKSLDFLQARNKTAIDSLLDFPEIGFMVSDQILNSPKFKKLLQEKPKFDLLLQEAFVSEGLMAGLARYFNVPFIGYATFIPSSWTNYMVGNIAPTSHIPEPFSRYPYRMNFQERAWNLILSLICVGNYKLFYLPRQDALMRKHFGNDHPYVEDIIKNMSVLFINDHVSTSFPRPSVPNMVSIGGLHITKPKPLPQDLQTYLDNSKKGAILFSLGSNVKAALMPVEKRKLILDAFSKLELNVLWKFEEDIPNPPKNVKISKWLPQSDILAHPNIKVFMTHGGLLSTTEAIARAVPIVGIPIFADQPTNMAMAVNAGFGLSLNFDQLTSEGIIEAVQEVASNPKYKEAISLHSKKYHDRILPPLDLAMWWIEHVLRHNGATHYRSAVQDLMWYQEYQLDVIALIIAVLATILYIIKTILCTLYGLVTKSNVPEKKKRN